MTYGKFTLIKSISLLSIPSIFLHHEQGWFNVRYSDLLLLFLTAAVANVVGSGIWSKTTWLVDMVSLVWCRRFIDKAKWRKRHITQRV